MSTANSGAPDRAQSGLDGRTTSAANGALDGRAQLAPLSVNWHLWPWCNYRCLFCYATFADVKQPLPRVEALRIPPLLAAAGTAKITFAGGEPLLCPYLPALVRSAKDAGMTTMAVTNASMIDAGRLAEFAGALDWIGLSIDSPIEATQARLGRGRGDHVARVIEAAQLVKEAGIRLKVNTVVTSSNWQEDFHDLVRRLGPERWKVFQVLPIAGENDLHIQPLAVTKEQFAAFVERHADLGPVAEDNDAMTGSYLMLDPLGRFYQNEGGRYRVSQPALEVGVGAALSQTGWSDAKFIDRGGLYPWATPRGVA